MYRAMRSARGEGPRRTDAMGPSGDRAVRSPPSVQPSRQVRFDESTTLIDGNELWTTPVQSISKYEAYLKDTQRVLAYRNAILRLHADFIKDKIVLDISKKNGHYAGFAVRAGASKCYILETTMKEAEHTQNLLNLNGYQDRCVVKQCESVKYLEIDEKCVDVIIHESMGECLFVMSGIKEVLDARDKFLRSRDGLILPNETSLHIAGIQNEELRQHSIDFWCRPIEGLSFQNLREAALSEPEISYVSPENVVTKEVFLARFNLYTATVRDLFVDAPFFVEAVSSCNITGFAVFFKVDFGRWSVRGEAKTGMSTSPLAAVTGWEHCVFPIDRVIPVEGRGEQVLARLKFYATNKDMATDFAAELQVAYSRKDKRISEKRNYTFYDTNGVESH